MFRENAPHPVYSGLRLYARPDEGYGIWLPTGWRQIEMTGDHNGAVFTPYPDHNNTCIAVEKRILPIQVVRGDVPVLRKGLEDGLKTLPGLEVESIEETLTETFIYFDAKFTFLEEGQRRKRWLRNIYWNEAQLVVLAQGQTVEEYEFYMPVFFNTMMTIDAGRPA